MGVYDKYTVQPAIIDTTGSTTIRYSEYFDMANCRRADFYFTGKLVPALAAATENQVWTIGLYQASNATGGGSSAISSATAVVGKAATAGITTATPCRELWLRFGTMASDTAITLTIGTAAYISSTSGSAAHYFAAAASAQATVASEGFAAMFNSTANNTATAITANWAAATDAAGAFIRIYRKDPESTVSLTGASTGCSAVSFGGIYTAHLGIDAQHMKKRYVAIGAYSTENAQPFSIVVVREPEVLPPKRLWQYSKNMSETTGF